MKWLFRLAFRGQVQHVHHMREEIAWLRGQMEYERRRADAAVDQLLVWRGQAQAITPAAPLTPAQASAAAALEAMYRSPELASMGTADGV